MINEREPLLNKLNEYKNDKGNHHAGSLFKKWEKLSNEKSFEENRKEKYLFFLLEAIDKYIDYRESISNVAKNLNFEEITNKLDNYIKFSKTVGKNMGFSDQGKKSFQSSILEEFLYILFSKKDEDWSELSIGKGNAYSNIYFNPKGFVDFLKESSFKVEEKNQDFSIYKKCYITIDNIRKEIKIPILSIECKTYIDKTMLQGSIATAEKIKRGNPYAKFYIVTETYGVSIDEDLHGTQIDQIYVLRKQIRDKNEENLQKIDSSVIENLWKDVKNFLNKNEIWRNNEEFIKTRGKLLNKN